MSISYTRHNKASEKYHEVKLWGGGGGARGAYLAHGLIVSIILRICIKCTLVPFISFGDAGNDLICVLNAD